MTNADLCDRENSPLEAISCILGQHIAPGALMACWITNNAAVRDGALDMLSGWGLELIEEWAWLKVTQKGEPVTEINGVWRKPYEVLLVGRKPDFTRPVCGCRRDPPANVMRRVIVAVPDIHSRKPNLRDLLAQLLPRRISDYRCLEIFARNLTAGWCAWGNEVLKYNDVQAWAPSVENGRPSVDCPHPQVDTLEG